MKWPENVKCQTVTISNIRYIVPDCTLVTCAYSIQFAGLGGMRHNTVVICWPDSWRKKTTWGVFIGECSLCTLCVYCELQVGCPDR